MPLKELSVRGFRNIAESRLEFDPGANFLFGPNGAGKTSLLEAIHYLATGRSFRRSTDAELLGFGEPVLAVAGSGEAGRAEIRFDGREKRVILNRLNVQRLSDYFGWLPVVALLLDDIELVRGGPGLRRGFLDTAIAKADREYVKVVGEYRRALGQCARLLQNGSAAGSELETWEEELVRTGVPVYERRRQMLAKLLPDAGGHFERFGAGAGQYGYKSSVPLDGDVAARFRERLAQTRKRAAELGLVLAGPHRDDLVIQRDGRDLRRFGSVGEQRLAAIALRLAEADSVSAGRNERPVFLLDEVASELDEKNGRLVFELVQERGQFLYAAARRFEMSGREFQVAQGKVEAIPQSR